MTAVAEPPAPSAAPAEAVDALRKYWGYEAFRPLQGEAVSATLEGRDSLVILPTGGGKSLCFQVPAVVRAGVTVCVSPLISLMQDQVQALQANGIAAAAWNSTVGAAQSRQIQEDMRSGALKLLYVAPERLTQDWVLDALGESGQLAGFAIDEAHCVSTWGHDFRPHYQQLSVLRERFPDVPMAALTATATPRVREDIVRGLGLRSPETLVGSFDRPNLNYSVLQREDRTRQILELADRHPRDSGIVYCTTRKEVDEITAILNAKGYDARAYHAGLPDAEREEAQTAFIKSQCRIIVATIAFGMGIDKPDVRFVVHASLPKSVENYQQEAGRAGRDGEPSDCVLLYSFGDLKTWEFIIGKSPGPNAQAQKQAVRDALDFCQSMQCRHVALVEHFGQTMEADCKTACDNCTTDREMMPAAEALQASQKILSCVYRLGQRFGAAQTVDVLRGSRAKKVVEKGHDALSTYGLMKGVDASVVRNWINQLIAQDYLAQVGEYSVLNLTEAAGAVFKGEATPELTAAPLTSSNAAAAPAVVDDENTVALFEELRDLRGDFARDKGVPPYIIFGDATLRDMARRRPLREDQMLRCKGVGQTKLATYGGAFIERIKAFCDKNGLTIRAETPALIRGQGGSTKNDIKELAMEMFAEHASVEDVVGRTGRAPSTIGNYLAEHIENEGIGDPSPWVSTRMAELVEEAIERVGCERLRPVFEALDSEVDYETIKTVAACWKVRQENGE